MSARVSEAEAMATGHDAQDHDELGQATRRHVESMRAEIEAVGLALARTVGLDAADGQLVDVLDRPALLVERYDRDPSAPGGRIHQEDMCQALGVYPRRKYEGDGGPSALRIIDLGVIFLVLHAFSRAGRFLQTATALVGTGVLLNLVYVPLLHWNEVWQAPPTELTLPRLLIVGMLLWSFDVAGYILSRALEKPYVVGVSIVVVYEIASIALRQALFPAAS